MNYFNEKTVLITGAFGGFGKHFTSQLASYGADLILTDLRIPPEKYDTGIEERIVGRIPVDLSTSEGCLELYKKASELEKPPDVIIHNAGLAEFGNYVDVPLENIERTINVNLLSVMRLNKYFLPQLINNRAGHLIYISSVAGFVATPYAVPYTTSKFGLRALAMAVHGEVRTHGIRTSIVYPFFSKTSIMKSKVFGNPNIKTMPDFFAGDPEYVVRTTLRGASKGKLHIQPDYFSKFMWQAVRFAPVIAEQRLMRHELIDDR